MGTQSNNNPRSEPGGPRPSAQRSMPRAPLALCLLRLGAMLACLTSPCFGQSSGAAIPLQLPSGLVYDLQGDLFFADTAAHTVFELSAAGVLTAVASTGTQGFSGDGGPATSAQLDSPQGLALDAAGDLYIADTHNHRVRRLAAAGGTIATVAGTGVAGSSGDGGPATVAQLDLPVALAVDAAGNLYLADAGAHRIRRIDQGTGAIATVAGNGIQGFSGDNGPATAASIDSPSGIAVDGLGNLYLSDTHNQRIREVVATTGVIVTLAGSPQAGFQGDGGAAATAQFTLPGGLAIDASGNLYVADRGNQRVRRIAGLGGAPGAATSIDTVAGQGTQAFAGDGGPAASASLNSPSAMALTSAGQVTLADGGNRRIRQLDRSAPPGPDIHTVAGLGITTVGETLSLSGPAVAAYGSGTVTATLTPGSGATGALTLLDVASGSPVTVGTAGLNAGSTSFTTALLAAGEHRLLATYPGDATHAAAESSALAMSLTPLPVVASPNAAVVLYGLPIPQLTGTLSGILPRDAAAVSVVFTTPAVSLSPVGVYPIAATLSGPAAPDYSLQQPLALSASALTIAKAPSQTTIAPSASSIPPGAALSVAVTVASTTSGTPTGSVVLLDGGATLTSVPLSPTGSASYTTSSLAQGSHALAAVYTGDGNFQASTSTAASVLVGAASDFTVAATSPSTQLVAAGTAATFTFSVTPQGTPLQSPITLTVQGLPPGATASFDPALLPPGGSITSFSLTIQTAQAVQLKPPAPVGQGPVAVAFALLLPGAWRMRAGRCRLSLKKLGTWTVSLGMMCILLSAPSLGCGNRVNTAPETTAARAYSVLVLATTTGPSGNAIQHSTNVTLQVL